MSDFVEHRLIAAGFRLPPLPDAKGRYRTAARHDDVLHLSAHGPFGEDGGFTHVGAVGGELSIDEGRLAAQACALALLASARQTVGTLDAVEEVLTLRGYVHALPGFTDQAAVVDGASEVLEVAFGDRGRAARTTVGVAGLPFGLPVVVEATMAIGDPS